MADEIAAALTQHDRVRRSTDIPLFYGKKGRDTVTPQQLIERLEKAGRIATWDEQRICDEFYMCLRDGAMSWYNTLENIPGFDLRNWANIQEEFMKAYAPRFTAKTLCTNFQDLRQKQDQNVQDYYNQVSDVFRDAYKVKPDHVIDHPAANRHGLTRAQANEIRMTGIMAMQLLMMNTVFIGGLREEIRSKVLEAGPTLIQESWLVKSRSSYMIRRSRVPQSPASKKSKEVQEKKMMMKYWRSSTRSGLDVANRRISSGPAKERPEVP